MSLHKIKQDDFSEASYTYRITEVGDIVRNNAGDYYLIISMKQINRPFGYNLCTGKSRPLTLYRDFHPNSLNITKQGIKDEEKKES